MSASKFSSATISNERLERLLAGITLRELSNATAAPGLAPISVSSLSEFERGTLNLTPVLMERRRRALDVLKERTT